MRCFLRNAGIRLLSTGRPPIVCYTVFHKK